MERHRFQNVRDRCSVMTYLNNVSLDLDLLGLIPEIFSSCRWSIEEGLTTYKVVQFFIIVKTHGDSIHPVIITITIQLNISKNVKPWKMWSPAILPVGSKLEKQNVV